MYKDREVATGLGRVRSQKSEVRSQKSQAQQAHVSHTRRITHEKPLCFSIIVTLLRFFLRTSLSLSQSQDGDIVAVLQGDCPIPLRWPSLASLWVCRPF
ncbi:hypothetical protein VNO78_17877 [Psophocarpus tetragonolobus]|uniref:Uncharacterized protein n=1 Tax=Psophocarpus tetragonolobus TaxID=3891 RepID=A0AAN9XLH3_PSOTE